MIFEKDTTLHKSTKILLQVAADVVCVVAVYYASLLLRFGAEIPSDIFAVFTLTVASIVLIYIVFFYVFSLCCSFWETTSIDELIVSVAATVCSSITVFFVALAANQTITKLKYIAGGLLVMMLTGYSRLNCQFQYVVTYSR